MTIERPYLSWPVYGVPHAEKSAQLGMLISALTWHHAEHCPPYRRVLEGRGLHSGETFALENLPFLPVRLFKEYELRSIDEADVFKVLTSSGTTSQRVSRIVLDRDTSIAQTRALVLIVQQFLGKARLPMLIIDHPGVIRNRASFSARGAGILGYSSFGRDHTYALRDADMALDFDTVTSFLARHRGERIFVFGFTFMIWRHLLAELERKSMALDFGEAVLIHGGGWKKLQDEAVDSETFRRRLQERCNIGAVHDFYGMVEQVGSVFMECEHGRLHSPAFGDVLIRNPHDWSVQPPGQRGVIQVLSLLPGSYPGNSLLTEDTGTCIGIDDCPCGRLGRTFWVHGRIPRTELRGCSDTYAAGLQAADDATIRVHV
ncbi:acyl-protein synthetase [Cupriavidus oxalaticus]|uniref:Acyl-protein synthetase n=1 Tax=Cupriavidus oxalaticus TaxID=96344 RepID=A0A5P3VCH4_9BURK|nr:acyl-protein synthetase [Cupriavidus oxalaticus]QEZ44076.1 acyl-protein synthetase [Cupriavidus oxalaticus]